MRTTLLPPKRPMYVEITVPDERTATTPSAIGSVAASLAPFSITSFALAMITNRMIQHDYLNSRQLNAMGV